MRLLVKYTTRESTTEKTGISAEDKERLVEVYRPFNTALLKLLDWPIQTVIKVD